MAAYSHLRTTVFISYCHKDKERYFDRLMVHLLPFIRDRKVHIWTDTMIPPGAMWPKAIEDAINSAKVAIFLVSADFLASDFIARNELPPLLAAAKQERASIIPVIIKPCLYNYSQLQYYQAFNETTRPLSTMKYDDREIIWMGVTELPRFGPKAREGEENAGGTAGTERDTTPEMHMKTASLQEVSPWLNIP